MMPSKSDFELRIPSSSWTSRSSNARGEQPGDRASASISGSGCYSIDAEADPSSLRRLLSAQLRRRSTFFTTRQQSGDLLQTSQYRVMEWLDHAVEDP